MYCRCLTRKLDCEPTDDKKINIALYHGSVSAVRQTLASCSNTALTSQSSKTTTMQCLVTFKTNQSLDHEGRVRYCGSTFSRIGESNDKGFLIWDIKDKDNFEVEHYQILNINPFVTVVLIRRERFQRTWNCPKVLVRIRSMNQILSVLCEKLKRL